MSSDAPIDDNSSPELTTWGVGPWQGELPTDKHYDPELLANGDTRNVLDHFRYWKMEAIVAELDSRRHKYHVAKLLSVFVLFQVCEQIPASNTGATYKQHLISLIFDS